MRKLLINKECVVLGISSFLIFLIWAIVIPVFQAPDEPAHFYYVQYISERKTLPKPSSETISRASPYLENALEALYFNYIIQTTAVRYPYQNGTIGEYEMDLKKNSWNPISDKNYSYPGLDYPPLYYLLNAPFYFAFFPNLISQIMAMRFFSCLLSAFFVIVSFFSFKKLFKDQRISFVLSLSIAFLPMFSFISGSINNDNLINLLMSVFFFLIIKYWNKPWDKYFYLFLGLVTILALSTKTQSFFILPFFLFFLIFRWKLFYKTNKKLFFFVLSLITAPVLFYSTIILKNYFVDIVSFSKIYTFKAFFNLFFLVRYSRIYKSLFARFGWLDTLVANEYYIIIAIIILILVIFALMYIFKKKDRLFLYFLSCIATVDLIYGFYFMWIGSKTGIYNMPTQGRYYFFLLIPAFYVLFKGIDSFFKKSHKEMIFLVIGILLIIFNLVSLIQYVVPRFYI